MQIGQSLKAPTPQTAPAAPSQDAKGSKVVIKSKTPLATRSTETDPDKLRTQLDGERERRKRLEEELEATQKALAMAVALPPEPSSKPKPGEPAPKVSPVFDDLKAPPPAASKKGAPPPPAEAPATPLDPLAKMRKEVEEARRRYQKEKEEFERGEFAETPEAPATVGAGPVLAVPIGFLGFDGHTVIARSCFTAGKGEALHKLLGSFLQQWSKWPYPPLARVTRAGLVIALPRDPQQRSIRIMPTGAIFLQMGPQYVRYLRSLPPIVSVGKREDEPV